MSTKTHWKNLANYDYLGAYSLEGIAQEVTVTISALKQERVTANGGKSEDCNIAYFEETEVNGVTIKPMVLNKTNCKTIEAMYGPFIEDWVGKEITVFATTTKFQRDVVPCLRVKNTKVQNITATQAVTQKQAEHTCAICGKGIDNRTYNAIMKAYNVSVCSKECYNKYLEENNNNNNEEEGENN